jgi:ATP-dependent protease HslVU (ClpYQ) ATPase subunit
VLFDPKSPTRHLNAPNKFASVSSQGNTAFDINDIAQLFQTKSKKLRTTVQEGMSIVKELELERLTTNEEVLREAKDLVENNGIVFIDEIDKICVKREEASYRGDASDEGVQRDLLPLIEGTNIPTKYGSINTSKILFIACGAFHSVIQSFFFFSFAHFLLSLSFFFLTLISLTNVV